MIKNTEPSFRKPASTRDSAQTGWQSQVSSKGIKVKLRDAPSAQTQLCGLSSPYVPSPNAFLATLNHHKSSSVLLKRADGGVIKLNSAQV